MIPSIEKFKYYTLNILCETHLGAFNPSPLILQQSWDKIIAQVLIANDLYKKFLMIFMFSGANSVLWDLFSFQS